jgi:long-chain-acyl-CoA dehydrogenase
VRFTRRRCVLCLSCLLPHADWSQVRPFTEQWESAGEVPRELWNRAGELGLLCTTVSEQYGGAGVDVLYAAIGWEEQMYANASGPGFSLASEIVAPYIEHIGSEEQKVRYLPRMVTGECVTAIAMTESSGGSDLASIRTNAKRDGSDWVLNGSKMFITNGRHCDMVIVAAVTDPKAGAKGISLFLVDADSPGFSKGPHLKKLGLRAQDTCPLYFDNVRLPQEALLGEPGRGFMYMMKELPQERLLIAGMAQASSEFMFETTRAYCKERVAFGGPLVKLQTVAHKLAALKAEIVSTRALVDQCLDLHAQKRLDTQLASIAKYQVTEVQGKVADQCLQLHGGTGFMSDHDVSSWG